MDFTTKYIGLFVNILFLFAMLLLKIFVLLNQISFSENEQNGHFTWDFMLDFMRPGEEVINCLSIAVHTFALVYLNPYSEIYFFLPVKTSTRWKIGFS